MPVLVPQMCLAGNMVFTVGMCNRACCDEFITYHKGVTKIFQATGEALVTESRVCVHLKQVLLTIVTFDSLQKHNLQKQV